MDELPAEPSRRGTVDRSQARHIYQHELDTASRLADLGEDVKFVAPERCPRPDAQLSDGQHYEFKSPTGSNRGTVLDRIRRAADKGKENFILDLSWSEMSFDEASDLAQHAVDAYPGVQRIRIIGRETPGGPLDVTIAKGGG